MVSSRFQRSSSAATVERAAAIADVDHDEWMQDWPLEVADPSRLAEFVDLLWAADSKIPGAMGEDIAFELMCLVLYSLDAAEPDVRERFWPPVREVLLRSPRRYAHHILYWSLGSERRDGVWVPDPEWGTDDGNFAITPLVRSVLVEVGDELGVRF